MATRIGIEVSTGEMRAGIPKAFLESKEDAWAHGEHIATRLWGLIRELAPRLKRQDPRYYPGEMADSTTISQTEPGIWEIAVWARWSAYVEFGTMRHGRAQPFVRPAIAIVEAENS